jgi:hypothetical protein
MTGRPSVSVRIWRADRRTGNFGDALNTPLLAGLGLHAVPSGTAASVNPARCLFAIGSVLSSDHVGDVVGPIDVWGSGWRGEPISDTDRERLVIHAVRGPRTAAALDAPGVAMGDPALLLPGLMPAPPTRRERGAVFLPHLLDHGRHRAASVGCDRRLSAEVTQHGRHRPWGPPPLERTVTEIATAGFVLTGALHGAVVAQAYGVPWAPWSRGYVDCPEKWLDWAEYLGIDLHFVEDRRGGEHWWRHHGSQGRTRHLAPLLDAFPYPLERCPTLVPRGGLA